MNLRKNMLRLLFKGNNYSDFSKILRVSISLQDHKNRTSENNEVKELNRKIKEFQQLKNHIEFRLQQV